VRDRPGHFNEDMSGLDAFRAALNRQEGQFMRGATYIMNTPKDLKTESPGETVAKKLLERNASGQFIKREF
jgi:hypothetical protein